MAALYWEISYICHRKTLIRDDDYDEIILMGSILPDSPHRDICSLRTPAGRA